MVRCSGFKPIGRTQLVNVCLTERNDPLVDKDKDKSSDDSMKDER